MTRWKVANYFQLNVECPWETSPTFLHLSLLQFHPVELKVLFQEIHWILANHLDLEKTLNPEINPRNFGITYPVHFDSKMNLFGKSQLKVMSARGHFQMMTATNTQFFKDW